MNDVHSRAYVRAVNLVLRCSQFPKCTKLVVKMGAEVKFASVRNLFFVTFPYVHFKIFFFFGPRFSSFILLQLEIVFQTEHYF